jgi:hypothetical protein
MLILQCRLELAQLLEYEPLATDQVPLLISMKEDVLALDKAIDSGDTDLGAHEQQPTVLALSLTRLICALLQCTWRCCTFTRLGRSTSFLRSCATSRWRATCTSRTASSRTSSRWRSAPLFQLLTLRSVRPQLWDFAQKFYYNLQKPTDAANIAVLEAYQCEVRLSALCAWRSCLLHVASWHLKDWKERMQGLVIALQFYQKDKSNELAAQVGRELRALFTVPSFAQATQEQIQLLQQQLKCEQEVSNVAFIDTSVR